MNPQPPEYIGHLFAFIFICVVVVNFVKEYLSNDKKHTISDNFVIGYIMDEPVVTNNTTTTTPPRFERIVPKSPPGPPDDYDDDRPDNDPPDDSPMKPIKPKRVKTEKATNKDYKTIFEAEQIYMDCVSALYALGVKKTEAKKITKEIFINKKPDSIQDFLMIALRKN